MDISSRTKLEITFTLQLNEIEARALEALVGYGVDSFLREFYKHMGRYYLEPHEKGLRSIFKTVWKEMPKQLQGIDDLRKRIRELKK